MGFRLAEAHLYHLTLFEVFMSIFLSEYVGEVVEVEGQCYRYIGPSTEPVSAVAIGTIFSDCIECQEALLGPLLLDGGDPDSLSTRDIDGGDPDSIGTSDIDGGTP